MLTGCCLAQTSALKVLPWNNHPAALSLTFDDSRTVHLDVVIPELNKRHLHATFFLIVSKTTRLDEWRKARLQGHEIGNHSVTHEHPADLNKATEELQVEDAKNFLDSNFNADDSHFRVSLHRSLTGITLLGEEIRLRGTRWARRRQRGIRHGGQATRLVRTAQPAQLYQV